MRCFVTTRFGTGGWGYEEDTVSVGFKALIDGALGGFEFVDVAYDTMRQRLVKSEEEIALIRQGVRICEAGGYAALEALKPGVTEVEMARAANIGNRRTSCAGASPISRSTTSTCAGSRPDPTGAESATS